MFRDSQVADSFRGHPFTGIADGAIDVDVDQRRIHERAHTQGQRIKLISQQFAHQVAFGDDSHELLGFHDEQRPDVFVRHALRRLEGRFVAADGFDGSFHQDTQRAVDIGERLHRPAVCIDEVPHQIAYRDDSEHIRAFGHHEVPHVFTLHQMTGIDHRTSRRDRDERTAHDVRHAGSRGNAARRQYLGDEIGFGDDSRNPAIVVRTIEAFDQHRTDASRPHLGGDGHDGGILRDDLQLAVHIVADVLARYGRHKSSFSST